MNIVIDSPVEKYHVRDEHTLGTTMNLGTLLHLVGLNRNSFNTLNRRSPLKFLEQNQLRKIGRDRYSFTHAAAVGCVLEFMNAGLPSARAAEAVEGLIPVIDAAVASIEQNEADGRWWLTVINFADGTWDWASRDQNADTHGGGLIVSKVSVNVEAVWNSMASRLGTTRDPSNCDD